jgi:hypothetical protein
MNATLRKATVPLLACVTFGAAFSAGGCYERTVAARGYGADRVDVYKANVPRDSATLNGRRKLEHKPLD